MMTISRPMKAEQAGGYFTREDYYLGGAEEGNSRWCGKGGEALGLEGPVREEGALSGGNPAGEQIVSHNRTQEKGALVDKHHA